MRRNRYPSLHHKRRSRNTEAVNDPMLLVCSEKELPAQERVWGTGGWLAPEDREALDWLTLARLSGWGVSITRPTSSPMAAEFSDARQWIIIACDPGELSEDFVAALASKLSIDPILLVARAGSGNQAFARLAGARQKPEPVRGHSLCWVGTGMERTWNCRNLLEAMPLDVAGESSVWATLDGAPIIAARQIGRGSIVTLGFHPSRLRDLDGAATALLRHMLIWGSTRTVAWLDLENTLVLRMDDAGGAQNVFNAQWFHPKLKSSDWDAIGTDLKDRNARLSIGYSVGWVDDGDAVRGTLKVSGREIPRIPGYVYPSLYVRYEDHAGHAPGSFHNYESEFQGIQALRQSGLGDVELHGYTHIHPDSVAWANAPDRYEAISWYRELGQAAERTMAVLPPEKHPLSLGMAAFQEYFGIRPTTLICPGDEWTNRALVRALDLGLSLVSSYYLALRHEDRFCWAQHVCAPYLDEPDAAWFDSGLPVVGYFHDRDVSLYGVAWQTKWLDTWQAAGAKRLLDFRQLAGAVGHRLDVEERNGELRVFITRQNAPAVVRDLRLAFHSPNGQLPVRLLVSIDGQERYLPVEQFEDFGRIIVPCETMGTGSEDVELM
jgi:hypothetical protein